MLVLSRKVGESVLVPEIGLEVTIVAVRGNTVRLEFKAPDSVDIFREEVYNRLRHPTATLPTDVKSCATSRTLHLAK